MEQRRTKRFSLRLPVSIQGVVQDGLTSNISSRGVLFSAKREPRLGVPIEYIITLGESDGRRVNLRCVGTVVRCESGRDPGFQVAATLERYEFVRL